MLARVNTELGLLSKEGGRRNPDVTWKGSATVGASAGFKFKAFGAGVEGKVEVAGGVEFGSGSGEEFDTAGKGVVILKLVGEAAGGTGSLQGKLVHDSPGDETYTLGVDVKTPDFRVPLASAELLYGAAVTGGELLRGFASKSFSPEEHSKPNKGRGDWKQRAQSAMKTLYGGLGRVGETVKNALLKTKESTGPEPVSRKLLFGAELSVESRNFKPSFSLEFYAGLGEAQDLEVDVGIAALKADWMKTQKALASFSW